jgi:hypothetical protein
MRHGVWRNSLTLSLFLPLHLSLQECHDVCVTVPFVLPEVKCTEATEKVEKCVKVPNKECKEECICLPQKSLTLALPKKPTVNLSLSKSGGL